MGAFIALEEGAPIDPGRVEKIALALKRSAVRLEILSRDEQSLA